MATWGLEINVKDLAAGAFSATGTRTDGEDVKAYTVTTRYDSGQSKAQNVAALASAIFGLYETESTALSDKAAFIASFNGDVVTALDALEA